MSLNYLMICKTSLVIACLVFLYRSVMQPSVRLLNDKGLPCFGRHVIISSRKATTSALNRQSLPLTYLDQIDSILEKGQIKCN